MGGLLRIHILILMVVIGLLWWVGFLLVHCLVQIDCGGP